MSAAGFGPTSPPWWLALPPVETEVSCGEQTHRLLWREGRLTALDHPDAEGELVLAALGGDRSECVDLVESWAARSDDLEILAVGPRSAADELTVRPDNIGDPRAGGGRVAYAPLSARPGPPVAFLQRRHIRAAHVSHLTARASHQVRPGMRRLHDETERSAARRTELLSLLALGAGFQFRLSATVAAAWADGGSRAGDRDASRPALVAALTGRLAPAAESWLRIDPGRVHASLHEDAGWGRLALSGTGSDRRLSAALPVGWLASVWAAGLAVIAGHLIVAVTEAAWPDATVLGVPEPGADPVLLKVRAAQRDSEEGRGGARGAGGGGWTAVAAGHGDPHRGGDGNGGTMSEAR